MVTRTATTDFDLFYEEWGGPVRSAIFQAGFQQADAEDLHQDIFHDLFRGGYLAKYDPSIGAFSTYIWGHVKIRIRGRKRDFWRRGQREFSPALNEDGSDSMPDIPDESDGLADTELSMLLDAVNSDLRHLPATESKDLARLFRDIVEQVVATGEFSQTDLAHKRGITRQAVSYQIRDLAKTSAMLRLRELLHA